MGIADLKRVTDLFIEGEEVVLRDGPEPVLLWVNKLNSFETEEARRDGMAARSRFILALKEIGTAEWANLQATVAEMGSAGLKAELVSLESNEIFLKVTDGIRADPDWAERLAAIERTTPDMTAEERAVVDKVNADYADEVLERVKVTTEQFQADLDRLDDGTLREKYQDKWLDARALNAFSREHAKTQLYFAVRTCRATTKLADTDAWNHAPCDGHRQRALDDREEATQLPDALLETLRDAVRDVTMARRDARFSGVLASSSASSAQPNAVAESTPSTPEESLPELATTSS